MTTLKSSIPERERSPNTANSDSEGVTDGTLEKGEVPQQSLAWGSDAPDGGLDAWLVVLGAWCTSFCSFGWINSEYIHYTATALQYRF